MKSAICCCPYFSSLAAFSIVLLMKQNRKFYPGRLRFACSEIIFIYFIFYILLFRKHCKLKSIKYVTMAKRVIDYVNLPSLKKIDHDFLIGLDSNRLYISVLIIKKSLEYPTGVNLILSIQKQLFQLYDIHFCFS